jgi:hypothetical protein
MAMAAITHPAAYNCKRKEIKEKNVICKYFYLQYLKLRQDSLAHQPFSWAYKRS